MSVEIRLVGALSGESLGSLSAERAWSVGALKDEVERLQGVPRTSQRLLLANRPLKDSEVLDALLVPGAASAELALVRLAHAAVIGKLAKGSLDLEDVDEELRGDFDVAMAAVRFDGHALKDASAELRGNKELALAAVQECSLALQHASPELRGDRELVLTAVTRCGAALRHASAELRGDAEVVKEAVRRDASILSIASESLRGDGAFMLEMVGLKGSLLEFASEDLRKDRGLVLAAVTRDPFAFAYAARPLQHDREFLLKEVIPINGCAVHFASNDIRDDPEILAAVEQHNPEYFAVTRHGQ